VIGMMRNIFDFFDVRCEIGGFKREKPIFNAQND
jgi:hypothetical protein